MQHHRQILISVFLLTVSTAGLASEKRDYQRAEGQNSAAAYQDFLRSYPDGKYAAQARTQLAAALAQLEDAAWKGVEGSNDKKTLQNFLDRFPDGRHAESARGRIKAQEDREERERAYGSLQDTVSAYESFQQKYPDVATDVVFQAKLRNAREKRDFDAAVSHSSVAELEGFLQANPTTIYAHAAATEIRRVRHASAECQDTLKRLEAMAGKKAPVILRGTLSPVLPDRLFGAAPPVGADGKPIPAASRPSWLLDTTCAEYGVIATPATKLTGLVRIREDWDPQLVMIAAQATLKSKYQVKGTLNGDRITAIEIVEQ